MATLYVRDVPDVLYARLREEAEVSRRSIGAAAITILQEGLGDRDELSIGTLLERARVIREHSHGAPADSSVANDIRDDRSR